MQVTIPYGREQVTVEVATDRLLTVQRGSAPVPVADPVAAVTAALEAPLHYPALRQALTPDDHVAVIVDERLPGLSRLLTAVLRHVTSAGVAADAITLLCPPSTLHREWVEELPDEFADVHVVTHNPEDRSQLAYLATTRAGRRVYLNRAVVDADQVVVLSAIRFDPLLGDAGAPGIIYPAFSDQATRRAWDEELAADTPADGPWPARDESCEVAWLLGAPFLVQVVEAEADAAAAVIAGSMEAAAAARQALARAWGGTVARRADTVVATISGDPALQDAGDMGRALANAARVVREGGRIVLLCHTEPNLGEGFQSLQAEEDPTAAYAALEKARPADWQAVAPWLTAAQRARLYIHSGLAAEAVEDLFATPMERAGQVQRLLDGEGDVVFLPDAHKLNVTSVDGD